MPRLGSVLENFLCLGEDLRDLAQQLRLFLDDVGMGGERHEQDVAELGNFAVHHVEIDLALAGLLHQHAGRLERQRGIDQILWKAAT